MGFNAKPELASRLRWVNSILNLGRDLCFG
jgi:hypothetical protein